LFCDKEHKDYIKEQKEKKHMQEDNDKSVCASIIIFIVFFFAQLHVQLGATLRARLRLLQP
jgi:hypothetical protein